MAKESNRKEELEKEIAELQQQLDIKRLTATAEQMKALVDPPQQEVPFNETLARKKWPSYYLSVKIEDLENPSKTEGTLGFTDAVGKRQIVINAPVDEWIKVLTALAKKAATKG